MTTAASDECARCMDANKMPAPRPIAVKSAAPRERRNVAGFCFVEIMEYLRVSGRRALLAPGRQMPGGRQSVLLLAYVSAPGEVWKLDDKDVIERSWKGQGQ